MRVVKPLVPADLAYYGPYRMMFECGFVSLGSLPRELVTTLIVFLLVLLKVGSYLLSVECRDYYAVFGACV